MSRTLMIIFPEKEPDTRHICYRGGCPLFTGEVQDGLCEVLWETPPESMKGKLACMCNFYDTMKPTIVEANGVNVQDVIKRVQKKEQPQGLDEAAHNHAANNGGRWLTDDVGIKCFAFNPQEVEDAFKAGAKWHEEQTPELPDSIGKAAKEWSEVFITEECKEACNYGFRVGAKWMAKQGVIVETRLYRAKGTPENEGLHFASLPFFSRIAEKININDGDKVIVQIRKI